ncbi:RING finger protein-like protein [Hyaloscypha variabilis F]|uniref:RING finger protein-like protein n=1 Tax=Hyaloscypha variabilis (strain UAMH 11265 / GT02V1 / F) TaxID=1149755 RepID=A0A2J6S9F2_HYAVF|nr:RING finger protein-like protein [Hyaloscypha variabilis F]
MMVLSGLLKPSSHNPPRRQPRALPQRASSTHSTDQSSPESASSANPQSDPYIHKEGHLAPIESEDPDLRELNNSLVALAAIFPDVQVEVFREMLSSFDEESRLAVVTETLLKHKMKWVRGRYRVAVKEAAQPESRRETQHGSKGNVPAEEKFRSAGYRKAVKSITYQEFKGLSRSTINAVLAEFNHSYTLARPTLVALSSKSWRFSLSSIFLRRKPISSSEVEHHPLVIWQSTGQGSIIPTLKATGSPELDKELFDSLIRPIQQRRLLELEEKDHTLALELNNTEAEKNDGLHDCECCFTSVTFEELSACDTGGHFICFQCVRRSVNEAVFGQGWQRNIDLDCGTLRCVAAMSDDCQGCIPQELVRRAFDEDKAGHEILRKLDERLAEDSLLKTNLPLIRCPFCSYAEVDELYLPESQRSWRLKRNGPSSLYTLVILILGVGMIPFLLPVFLVFSFLFLLVSSQQTFGDFAVTYLNSSIIRLRRKRLGLKFVCQSETCGRSSCISCSKAWNDIHICHESSLLALRTQVELAMSLAIKRTCPRCNTSFVKSSGCNKLTCVCGYQMCYVCRKDIGNGEGYRHFCEHFRPNGGRGCTECSKCDLYRCEDDEVVVKKAKEEAERQWMEKEGTVLGGDEKIRKVLEEKWKNDGEWWDVRWLQWKMPNWEQIFDSLIESVIE